MAPPTGAIRRLGDWFRLAELDKLGADAEAGLSTGPPAPWTRSVDREADREAGLRPPGSTRRWPGRGQSRGPSLSSSVFFPMGPLDARDRDRRTCGTGRRLHRRRAGGASDREGRTSSAGPSRRGARRRWSRARARPRRRRAGDVRRAAAAVRRALPAAAAGARARLPVRRRRRAQPPLDPAPRRPRQRRGPRRGPGGARGAARRGGRARPSASSRGRWRCSSTPRRSSTAASAT